MKNILINMVRRHGYLFLFTILVSPIVYMSGTLLNAATYFPITSQLDVGSRGVNVENLQIFLSAKPAIYPEGLVTGYFGSLTRAAVARFQTQYGISPVGRVGPMTISRINSLIASGEWTATSTPGTSDISGPWIYSISQIIAPNSATFSWNTNESATGKVFYNTAPLLFNEGDINSVGFGTTNGLTALNDNLARLSQQVTIQNLQTNTLYYYTIVATDLAGNVSIWNPNGTFRAGTSTTTTGPLTSTTTTATTTATTTTSTSTQTGTSTTSTTTYP